MAALIDSALRKAFDSRDDLLMYSMMAYHFGWHEQPGHADSPVPRAPTLGVACLASCKAVGGDLQMALPAALAIELVANALEIHDDVQDGNPKRRGRDSVWWVWGPAQGINVGDGMHALGRILLLELGVDGEHAETTFKAVQLLDTASLEVFEGRYQNLEAQERIDLTVDSYLKMARQRTAVLYATAMRLGTYLAGASESECDVFEHAGLSIGLASQIQSDISQLWESGPTASDEVLNKKKLLPVVHAIETADISAKRRFGDIYFRRVLEPSDIDSLKLLLDELGSNGYAKGLVQKYRSDAIESIQDSGVKSASELVDFLLSPR